MPITYPGRGWCLPNQICDISASLRTATTTRHLMEHQSRWRLTTALTCNTQPVGAVNPAKRRYEKDHYPGNTIPYCITILPEK